MGHMDTEALWIGQLFGVRNSEEDSPVSFLPRGKTRNKQTQPQ